MPPRMAPCLAGAARTVAARAVPSTAAVAGIRLLRRTFAERLPELVAPHARRTCRLDAAQGQTGVAFGGEAGSRLLQLVFITE